MLAQLEPNANPVFNVVNYGAVGDGKTDDSRVNLPHLNLHLDCIGYFFLHKQISYFLVQRVVNGVSMFIFHVLCFLLDLFFFSTGYALYNVLLNSAIFTRK